MVSGALQSAGGAALPGRLFADFTEKHGVVPILKMHRSLLHDFDGVIEVSDNCRRRDNATAGVAFAPISWEKR